MQLLKQVINYGLQQIMRFFPSCHKLTAGDKSYRNYCFINIHYNFGNYKKYVLNSVQLLKILTINYVLKVLKLQAINFIRALYC